MAVSFPKALLLSASGHVVALLLCALVCSVTVPSCRSKAKTVEIPLGFMVEPPPAEPEPPPETKPPEPKPVQKKPDTEKAKPKKPDPPKTNVVHKVQVSNKLIKPKTTPTTQPPRKTVAKPLGPKLTPQQIAAIMNQGGVPGGSPAGTPGASPDEDSLAMARIKNTLDNAWSRPTAEARGSRPAVLQLVFKPDGSFDAFIASSSGSSVLDRSVLDAAKGVRRITGLPAGFVRRYPSLNIEFNLEL